MRLNPFAGRGARGQSPKELRLASDRLTSDLGDRDRRLAAAKAEIATLVEERDWFHERWIEVGERVGQAERVAGDLEADLASARCKVAALEVIAGPYVDPDASAEPVFAAVQAERNGEITREFRALTAGVADGQPIGPITLVKPLAQMQGGAR
jgi:hypothetical protein